MPCSKTKTKTTPPATCPGNCTDGCGCLVAASKSAESAAASAKAAAQSAELAQKLLQNCLTDSTIEPGGGLKPSEDGHGITVDETWIDNHSLQPDEIKAGNGITVTPGADDVTVAAKIVEGGGLKNDAEGLSVDFSQMPTDKFEALVKSIHVPIWLERNTDFYVNGTTGADTLETGRGMSKELPFKTIQACVSYVTDNYNLSRYTATINIADGTYNEELGIGDFSCTTGQLKLVAENSGQVTIAASMVTPTTSSHHCVYYSGNQRLLFSGLKFELTVNTETSPCPYDAYLISNAGASRITFSKCEFIFNAVNGEARNTVLLWANGKNSINIINSSNKFVSNYTQGKKPVCLLAYVGQILTDNVAVEAERVQKISGTFECICRVVQGSFTKSLTYPVSFSAEGEVKGQRYLITQGGNCYTGGSGANYFPGDVDGTVDETTYSWYK